MADEKISFSVEVSTSEAIQRTGSLKAAIREAERQAQELSLKGFNEEALTAAKNAARLKEELSDMRDRIAALNPEAKFNAITQAAQGIAGGFAAAQGAMALFGNESEEVNKALLKVQGALALTEGLNAIRGLGDAFSNVKLIAVDAFKSIAAAIGSSGIGLLAIAIGAAATALWQYVSATSEAEKEQKKFNNALQRKIDLLNKSKEAEQKAYENEIKLAKAAGEDTVNLEIKKQEQLAKKAHELAILYNKRLNTLKHQLWQNGATEQEARDNEDVKKLRELKEQQLQIEKDAQNEIAVLSIAAFKARQDREDAEEAKRREKRLEKKKEFDHTFYFYNPLDQVEINPVVEAKKDELDELNQLSLEASQLADKEESERNARLKRERDAGIEQMAFREYLEQHKFELMQQGVSSMAKLGEIFMDNEQQLSEFQKDLALVQIGIDTARAIASAVSSAKGATTFDYVAQIGVAVGTVLTNIATAKKILSSSGKVKAGSLNIPSTATGITAPQTQAQTGGTGSAQVATGVDSQGNLVSGYMRAYVVESDISRKQARIGKIERNSKF